MPTAQQQEHEQLEIDNCGGDEEATPVAAIEQQKQEEQ